MEQMLSAALSQGLGYGLFCFLLIYVLKTQEKRDIASEKREEKYQDIIKELTEKYNIISNDVKDIKDYIKIRKEIKHD